MSREDIDMLRSFIELAATTGKKDDLDDIDIVKEYDLIQQHKSNLSK